MISLAADPHMITADPLNSQAPAAFGVPCCALLVLASSERPRDVNSHGHPARMHVKVYVMRATAPTASVSSCTGGRKRRRSRTLPFVPTIYQPDGTHKCQKAPTLYYYAPTRSTYYGTPWVSDTCPARWGRCPNAHQTQTRKN